MSDLHEGVPAEEPTNGQLPAGVTQRIKAQSLVSNTRYVLGVIFLSEFPTREGWLRFNVIHDLFDEHQALWARGLPKWPDARVGAIEIYGVTELGSTSAGTLLATLHVTPLDKNEGVAFRPHLLNPAFLPYLRKLLVWLDELTGVVPGRSEGATAAIIVDAGGPGGRMQWNIAEQDNMVSKWHISKKQGVHLEDFIKSYPTLTPGTFRRYVTSFNKRHKRHKRHATINDQANAQNERLL